VGEGTGGATRSSFGARRDRGGGGGAFNVVVFVGSFFVSGSDCTDDDIDAWRCRENSLSGMEDGGGGRSSAVRGTVSAVFALDSSEAETLLSKTTVSAFSIEFILFIVVVVLRGVFSPFKANKSRATRRIVLVPQTAVAARLRPISQRSSPSKRTTLR